MHTRNHRHTTRTFSVIRILWFREPLVYRRSTWTIKRSSVDTSARLLLRNCLRRYRPTCAIFWIFGTSTIQVRISSLHRRSLAQDNRWLSLPQGATLSFRRYLRPSPSTIVNGFLKRISEVLENFEGDLMRVLDRWHAEVIELAQEIRRINAIANPSADEKRRRQQLERTLGALTGRSGTTGRGGSSESYTLGYLSSHGFLPSYAFPGEAATLFAPEIDGGEVSREPSIAISEFAPENVVYV